MKQAWKYPPACLAEVRPLSTSLEIHPLVQVILLERVKGKKFLGVVLFDQVGQVRASFPKDEVGIGIHNS